MFVAVAQTKHLKLGSKKQWYASFWYFINKMINGLRENACLETVEFCTSTVSTQMEDFYDDCFSALCVRQAGLSGEETSGAQHSQRRLPDPHLIPYFTSKASQNPSRVLSHPWSKSLYLPPVFLGKETLQKEPTRWMKNTQTLEQEELFRRLEDSLTHFSRVAEAQDQFRWGGISSCRDLQAVFTLPET